PPSCRSRPRSHVWRPSLPPHAPTPRQTEIVELYEMRVVLERAAAGMAAKHASAAEIDTMVDLNAQIFAARADARAASAINQDFHRCIYLASRNRFLLASARALNNALMLLGPTTLDDKARIKTVCQQHDKIIEAIRSADDDDAGAAAALHLETSLRHRLKVQHT
ncbi:MAG: FCD domain-containing protein, partial [Silicimonas sp.]|nr:FCD domain-containing protein [Silicimonas sp.]